MTIKITTAQYIHTANEDTIKMMKIAESNAIGIDQDLERGKTIYTFSDNSRLSFSKIEVELL